MEEHPSCSSSSSLSASSYSSSTYSNPACSATTSIFSNLDDSKKSTNTEKCTKDLREQCWYWGAASKETISAAMEVCKLHLHFVNRGHHIGQLDIFF
jgi:hypothetical protein